MTLGQLRTFLAVADTGSVRSAAARLVVSQPAVSSAVNALQAELGVALTEREGRGLRLTPSGEAFAGYARRIIALLDGAADMAAGTAAPEQGRLRLAAVTTAAEHVVPAQLAAFRGAYPAARIQLEVGNRARVWDMLHHDEIDLVIAGRPPSTGPFAVRGLRANELLLVGPREVEPRDREALAGMTWLLREPGSGTRAVVEDILEQLGLEPPTLTLGSNGAIRASVEAGLGVSVLSRDAAGAALDAGRLLEWHLAPFPVARPWHAVVRADRPLPPTAGLFLERLLSPGGGFTPC